MNFVNGEVLVVGGFIVFWFYIVGNISFLLMIFIVVLLVFVVNWLIYCIMLELFVCCVKSCG